MKEKQTQSGAISRAAELNVSSYDERDNSIEVIFTTGAKVRRHSWSEGAYDEELVVKEGTVRLGRLNAGAPFLDTHSDYRLGNVLGSVIPGTARIAGGKGYARVQLSKRDEIKGIIQDIRDGVLRNISVGYRYHKVEKTDGQDGDAALWRVVDWEPMEISAVPIPADPGSQVRADAEKHSFTLVEEERTEDASEEEAEDETGDDRQDEKGVRSMSKDQNAHGGQATNKDEDKTVSKTENRAADPVVIENQPDPAIVAREAVAAERVRIADINKVAVKFGASGRELATRAIDEGMNVADFRALVIEKMETKQEEKRVSGEGRNEVGDPSNVEKRNIAIVDALMHRADPANHKVSDDAREFRGMTLLEIGKLCAEGEGKSLRGMSKPEQAAVILQPRHSGLLDDKRVGGLHTTSDFPTLLAAVANKTLRRAYEAAPQTFRPLVREVTVPDFKTVNRLQMGDAPQLEKVNEHGEFKRGTIGEGKESYAVLTYGKVVGVTRQVLINDDLGAFTRIPEMFGRQAANLESDLVWYQILGNPTMGDGTALFHATHGNLGTAAGISADSIGLSFEAMRLQKGLDGRTLLNLTPRYLITSVAAVMKSLQLLTSTSPNMSATQTSNIVPEYLRTLTPISEPRLDNGVTDPATGAVAAGSRFAWYTVADPNQIDTVELAYLEGNRGVYTESRMGFDIDGVETKVRLDVGAKVIDWHAFYKNPATAL